MDTNSIIAICSAVAAVAAAAGAIFAKQAKDTATDIKANGVTHIVAQVTPSTTVTPVVKTVVIDGVTYQSSDSS
jgi:hypothetical protein